MGGEGPLWVTVYNHGAQLTFFGGEDDNQSTAGGVSHLLDNSPAATSILNRAVTGENGGPFTTVAMGSNGGMISNIAGWGATFGGNGALRVSAGSDRGK
jgi:hypothetical protein